MGTRTPRAGLRLEIVGLLLAATVIATWLTYRQIAAFEQSRFDNEVQRIGYAVEQRMNAYMQVLRSGVGLFLASDEVTREDWRQFVAALRLSEHYPGFRAVTYSPAVTDAELPAFLASVRAAPLPADLMNPAIIRDYQLRAPPASGGATTLHSPILFIEPFTAENQHALGFDLMQEPIRRATMQRAAATGDVALTPRLVLAAQADAQPGFVAFVPVLRDGAVRGWINAAFRAQAFMQGLLGDSGSTLDIEIYDGASTDPGALMYSSRGLQGDGRPAALASADSSGLSRVTQITMPGRDWTLRFVAAPGFASLSDRLAPWLVALGGMLATLLFHAIARAAAQWREQAARLERQAEELRRAEAAVRHQATHDPLTGLANRSLFMDRLDTAVERGRRRTRPFALVYIDIDGFKPVNDSHGHHAGDELLKAIAERLLGTLRKEDTVARLGGDEFALIMEETCEPPAKVLRACAEIVDRLREPFVLPSGMARLTVQVGASVGVALYPAHGDAGDQLVAAADGAMYRAKRGGKNRAHLAEPGAPVDPG